jgi:hypothetical protein
MIKLFKIFIVLFAILHTSNCLACTCIGKSKIKHEIRASDLVFSGTVISKEIVVVPEEGVDKLFWFHYAKYTIAVDTKYKGAAQDTIVINTGIGKGSCGFKFEIGERYIIYANYTTEYSLKETELGTNICNRTMPYNEDEDNKIRKYKKLLSKS